MMEQGKTFKTYGKFIFNATELNVQQNTNFRIKKREKKCCKIEYIDENCPYYVYVRPVKGKGVVVTALDNNYTCIRGQEAIRPISSKSKFLVKKVLDIT